MSPVYNKHEKEVCVFHAPWVKLLDNLASLAGGLFIFFWISWDVFLTIKWPWLESYSPLLWIAWMIITPVLFVSYWIVRKNSHIVKTHWY